MGTAITRLDYYLPEIIVDNKQLAEEFPDWSTAKIEKKVGVRQRHITKENETALDLAYQAAQNVLADYDKSCIDLLLLCTQSPDYYLPTTACILQDRLGLNTNTGAFDFNLGCSGYVYGLAIAKGFINSGLANTVLLMTSETYSKHIHPQDKANRTIFGDGATATILERSEEEHILEFDFGTDGKGMGNLIVPNGGLRQRYDVSSSEITDESGNIRTKNHLYMNGPEIFNFTIEAVPITVQNALKKNTMTLEEIDYVIFHQANKYILDYLRKKTKIPKEKFYNNLLTTGNTVSSTIPIALKNSLEQHVITKGDKILLCGFGVGYSWGTTIILI